MSQPQKLPVWKPDHNDWHLAWAGTTTSLCIGTALVDDFGEIDLDQPLPKGTSKCDLCDKIAKRNEFAIR